MGEHTSDFRLETSSGHELEVTGFRITQRLSAPFVVDLELVSQGASLEHAAIVGHEARFSIAERSWAGYCCHLGQAAPRRDDTFVYSLRIVPKLWLLTQRSNYRMFQGLSDLEVIAQLLREWEIEHQVRCEDGRHPRRSYCVQYGETDYAFVCRLLERTGVATFYAPEDGHRKLILSDTLTAQPVRATVEFVAAPQRWREPLVTNLQMQHEMAPFRVLLRDRDLRHPPRYEQLATASAPGEFPEHVRLEHFEYAPGAFEVARSGDGGTPVADDRGAYRSDEGHGRQLAATLLASLRQGDGVVTFETSELALEPGTVLAVTRHPLPRVGASPLLVTESTAVHMPSGEWHVSCRARLADEPYRPPRVTPKPTTRGLELATVVGPAGEEIHVDEMGRARVRFHWDRSGCMNEECSAWIPVSQQWAGAGFGHVALPRVGQEVLVDFLGGDPDRPVIVGRLSTPLQPSPYPLPQEKTRSGWRSRTTPGGEGFNELMMDDAAGAELVNIQAQRDLTKLVKNDESLIVGGNLDSATLGSESFSVGGSRTATIGERLSIRVGTESVHRAGQLQQLSIEPCPRPTPTTLSITDERIVLDTGAGATLTLEGDEIRLNARSITLLAERELKHKVDNGALSLLGGPMVKVNC